MTDADTPADDCDADAGPHPHRRTIIGTIIAGTALTLGGCYYGITDDDPTVGGDNETNETNETDETGGANDTDTGDEPTEPDPTTDPATNSTNPNDC